MRTFIACANCRQCPTNDDNRQLLDMAVSLGMPFICIDCLGNLTERELTRASIRAAYGVDPTDDEVTAMLAKGDQIWAATNPEHPDIEAARAVPPLHPARHPVFPYGWPPRTRIERELAGR